MGNYSNGINLKLDYAVRIVPVFCYYYKLDIILTHTSLPIAIYQ